MWWNFVGRSHDDVVAARDRWMREIGEGVPEGEELFGPFPEAQPAALPAPALPGGRLRARG